MSVRAITFDLDDTLWPVKPTLIRAEMETYDWLKENASALTDRFTLKDIAEHRYRLFVDSEQYKNQISQLRIATIKQLAILSDYSERDAHALATQSFDVHYELRQQVNCYAGVEELLDQLRGDYVLGAISNGNADVSKTPIGHYFSFALSAEQVNASKPDNIIFTRAHAHIEAELGSAITTGEIVHVGDDFYCDVYGAKQAQFKAIWLKEGSQDNKHDTAAGVTHYSKDKEKTVDAEADAIISDITQLPAALTQIISS